MGFSLPTSQAGGQAVPTTGLSSVTGFNRLLDALHADACALLEPHLKEFALDQGALLQEQGEKIEYVYFPQSGMISLLAVMKHGDAIETATVGREGAVGAMVGLGLRISFTRARVQMPGVALRIATPRFQEAVEKSSAIRDVTLRYNELLLVQVQQAAACNALHDVQQRLCRWLIQTRDRTDTDIIPYTQEFLAQILGVRRTTVSQIARQLQQSGAIRYHRGRIEVTDRKKLENAACECYAIVRKQTERYLPRVRE
jgi:CRP-like cAMP-binding protein